MDCLNAVILMACIVNLVSADAPKPSPYEANNKLFFDLLNDYHEEVPPLPTNGGPVQVEIAFSLQSFDFTDEANEIATVHGYRKLAWNDSRLSWDPEAYNNISVVSIDIDRIWSPDIELYNSAKVTKTIEQQALLYSNGLVCTFPSYHIEFLCPMTMGLLYFPYDTQICHLQYGSWQNNADIINLTPMAPEMDLEDHRSRRKFELIETTARRYELAYSYAGLRPGVVHVHVTYTILLKRSSELYTTKLVLPSVLTGFLVLLTFLLPPTSYEKITLCGIVFLCLLVLLIYLHLIIPSAGDTIIGKYLAFALFIDFFATVMAVISYHTNTRLSPQQTQSEIEMDTAGDNNDLKLQMPKERKRKCLRHLDIVSFILFSIVFIVGLAIILGHR